MNNKEIGKNLIDAVTDANLKNVILENSEIIIDTFFNEGVLKDIPLINSIRGLFKTGLNIRNARFLRNFVEFFNNLENIEPDKRQKFIDSLSSKQKDELGFTILDILEDSNSTKKIKWVSKALNSLIADLISKKEFYDLLYAINLMKLHYLEEFIDLVYLKYNRVPQYALDHFYNCGFLLTKRITDLPGDQKLGGFQVALVARHLSEMCLSIERSDLRTRMEQLIFQELEIKKARFKEYGYQLLNKLTAEQLIQYLQQFDLSQLIELNIERFYIDKSCFRLEKLDMNYLLFKLN